MAVLDHVCGVFLDDIADVVVQQKVAKVVLSGSPDWTMLITNPSCFENHIE